MVATYLGMRGGSAIIDHGSTRQSWLGTKEPRITSAAFFCGKDSAVSGLLDDRTVLVIGRGSGIARAVSLAAREAGAHVVVAGRDANQLTSDYEGESDVSIQTVDVTDDRSIEALARRLESVDHVVSTASARARGRLADLDREAVRVSLDTKVIGPLMLAKHFAPRIKEGGSFVIFSGVAAFKIAIGTMAVAITNGAAEVLVRSLALELAPIRVNGISPGVIDTGAWDALGDQGKTDYFKEMSTRNPVRHIGRVEDIAAGVLFAMTNSFLTGQTLRIDGGEPLT
jgi:NAD(P)-dependent dehydrogenase (short-subunit alcohol dehydrogenase family)